MGKDTHPVIRRRRTQWILVELERALKFAPEEASRASKTYEEARDAADAEMPECPVTIAYRDRGRRGEKLYPTTVVQLVCNADCPTKNHKAKGFLRKSLLNERS